MPPKSKTDPIEPDETTPAEYATADEMATVLDTLADMSDRLAAVERAQTAKTAEPDRFRDERQAAAARTDPVFRAQAGVGERRRQSEGDRQDAILRENAERHLHERAGDGVPTMPMTSGVPASTDEPGEGGMEDAASPHFEDAGGMAQIDETPERTDVDTNDSAALNPTR